MSSKLTSSSTKAQVVEAYEQLEKDYKKLATELDRVKEERDDAANRAARVPASSAAPAAAKGEGISAATIEQIIGSLTTLRNGFGTASSKLSTGLVAEATRLQDLRRQNTDTTQQLAALHKLQITAETLADLICAYDDKTRQFEADAAQKRAAFATEMADKKKAWQKEQADADTRIKERNEAAKSGQKREAAEYKYQLDMSRKLDADQYAQQQKQLKKELERVEEVKRAEWAVREEKISVQEQEYAQSRSRVENLSKELEASVKKAREETTKRAQRKIQIEVDLRAKETEGERRLQELQVKSLEDIITQQGQQLAGLRAQLEAAQQQARDLAVKAIEGVSNVDSFKAMKEIALEQARKRSEK